MRFRNVCALIGAAILGLTLFGAGPAVAEVSQTSYERSGTVIDVADSSFSADVLQAQGPVLVAFRAEWSAVCRALDPVLVDVARAHGSQLTVARLDIDQSPPDTPQVQRHRHPHPGRVQERLCGRHQDRTGQQKRCGKADRAVPVIAAATSPQDLQRL